jgi:metallo-beta-lactamase family protein
MCNGGRILHHFKREIGKPNTHVVFTGFQPPGTMGRAIIDGAESIRIFGERYPVRAQIHTIGGFSAHGDQDDLLRWYGAIAERPPVYLVHGEPEVAEVLQRKLEYLGTKTAIARSGQTLDLTTLG